jgi:isoleucyl-tRNA synthetase
MPDLEKWILHRLAELHELHKTCTQEFDYLTFYTQLHTFCTVDLSAFYFDIRKDALYCDAKNSTTRRATRTVMDTVFNTLVRWLAPVLSFTAEEAWLAYTKQETPTHSIHEQLFMEIQEKWLNPDLAERYDTIRNLRRVMTGALEVERNAKTIGSSLQADINIYVSADLFDILDKVDLSELAITSDAQLLIAKAPANAFSIDDIPNIGVVVNIAEGSKCQRCWKIKPEVGQEDREHPHVCKRCENVVQQ